MASGLSYRYFHSQRSNNLAIIQAHIFSVRGKVWIVIVLTENIILSMDYILVVIDIWWLLYEYTVELQISICGWILLVALQVITASHEGYNPKSFIGIGCCYCGNDPIYWHTLCFHLRPQSVINHPAPNPHLHCKWWSMHCQSQSWICLIFWVISEPQSPLRRLVMS